MTEYRWASSKPLVRHGPGRAPLLRNEHGVLCLASGEVATDDDMRCVGPPVTQTIYEGEAFTPSSGEMAATPDRIEVEQAGGEWILLRDLEAFEERKQSGKLLAALAKLQKSHGDKRFVSVVEAMLLAIRYDSPRGASIGAATPGRAPVNVG